MTVSFEEYKGYPMIKLQGNNGVPFSFGKAKAKLIVKYIDEIKEFAEE